MKDLFLIIIGIYRRYLSPLFPPSCRFTPTCSEYATEAFSRKNAWTALGMTLVRISKCHPFHPGGYDPIDQVGKQREICAGGAVINSDADNAHSCRHK